MGKVWPALAIVAFVLAGCGGSSNPADQVAGAAKRTLALHWVRYNLTFDRPRLFGPAVRVVGGRAVFNVDDRLAYETLDLQKPEGSQLLWVDLTPTTLLVDPDPPPSGVLPAGKIWISVHLPGAGAVAGQAEALSVELPLNELASATVAATHVRSTVVNQVPTDEYRVTVDLSKAQAAAEARHLDALAAAIKNELRASSSPRLSLLVWVNGPGYVSRIDEAVPGSGLGTVSLQFTNFRLKYTGTLPPSSQTVPLSGLPPGAISVWSAATGS